ncbi:7500_t:CDS:2 [Cetraspora pellucida]|uniref:7500_t:CDS:1 n=1 Tax=Cetraspora pellucida TaxID=1433469 RepID=A0A9N8VNP8_9GLOM|nr:7500_t:CDS:2 [Cetraspora pellucida]
MGPYSTPEYRKDFYVEGALLMCCACCIVLNYKKKLVLNDLLISTKYQVAKIAANNSVQVQQNINVVHLSEREQMNLDLVQALTVIDIFLKKLDNDKLKEFFKKYCKFVPISLAYKKKVSSFYGLCSF